MPPERDLSIPEPHPTEFLGKVALVTGAAGGGIGETTARRLAAGGATVVVTDKHQRRTEQVAEDMAASFATPVVGHVLDIGIRDDIARVVDDVAENVGPIQILVNNAAINKLASIWDYDVDDWDRILEADLTAPWLLAKRVMPQMRDAGGGAIVNVSSFGADRGGALHMPYSAAKAGLQALTRDIAHEGGPAHIRCNTVSTGVVRGTKFIEDRWDETWRPSGPLPDWIWPEDVAETIAFFVSDRARMITGEVLDVCGGDYMRP
jgi:3-oxoacyl-[acyl-carrier protein] reductase